jgi:Glycosyl hydrolases family 39
MKRLGALFACLLLCLSMADSKSPVQITPPSQPIPAAYFGMHIHNVVAPSRTGARTPWPGLPVPTWRLWDSQVTWADIEPNKGQWKFDLLDKYLALADAHHAEILLPLGVTPQWASSQPDMKSGWQPPGRTAPPRDIQDWRDYVAKVAAHCKGRIHEYEIWNEPNLKQYWVGTPEQLVALTREAHDIIKGIDPSALIVSPAATTSAGIGWLTEFLGNGGAQYIDVVGYHFYVTPQQPEGILGLVQRVKQTMASNGAADKPIWCTEIGWQEPKPFPSDELGAAYLTRVYILAWASGIQRLYWYSWDNHSGVSLETTTSDNQTAKAAGLAYGVIQQWLSGAIMNSCNRGTDDSWSCQITQNGASEVIVWNASGPASLKVPSSWHVTGITSLLGQSQSITGGSVAINTGPQLLTSYTQ